MSGIDIFTGEYLGKIFYFCLKKTGNEQDAAELAGDISLQVVQALSKGTQPEQFDGWLWAVVRNRWARWAAGRYYGSPEQVDIQEYEQDLASGQCLEEEYIRSWDLMRIRRELAFVRSDYRQILVAHYFEEMSVSEISRRFGIPIGTVKTRLRNSRRILKEGMNMARQFGTRSFQPEHIYFSSSGAQPSGLLWSAVGRKIPINILCAANNNPSTIEELSMELGISMPYMEEEVHILEEAELLRKLSGEKYLTNFFISPRECQNEINELSCRFAESRYGDIWALAGRALPAAKERFAQVSAVSDMDGQAYLAFHIEQQLENAALPSGIFEKFHRRDGGNWGFIGKEQNASCRLPYAFFNNSCAQTMACPSTRWDGFYCHDITYGKMPYKQDVPAADSLSVIKMLAQEMLAQKMFAQEQTPKDFSDTERQLLDRLLSDGFCVKSPEGEIRIAALIFDRDTARKCESHYSTLPEYQSLQTDMNSYMREAREIIARYSSPFLKEDFEYYVGMSVELRHLFAVQWKNSELYRGGNAQFMAFYF